MPALGKRNLFAQGRISLIGVKSSILMLISMAVAQSQVFPPGGGYPGQSPYPGQYPDRRPQNGPSLPIPGRKDKSSDSKNSQQPMPNFRGTLRLMDEKSISLELGDKRVLDFKRTDKTKFLKNGDEVKSPKFNPGDQISVEALEDPGGYMRAVNVYWEKAAGGATGAKTDDGAVDTWKDAPAAGTSHASDDPDRPVLKRADSAGTSKAEPKAQPED